MTTSTTTLTTTTTTTTTAMSRPSWCISALVAVVALVMAAALPGVLPGQPPDQWGRHFNASADGSAVGARLAPAGLVFPAGSPVGTLGYSGGAFVFDRPVSGTTFTGSGAVTGASLVATGAITGSSASITNLLEAGNLTATGSVSGTVGVFSTKATIGGHDLTMTGAAALNQSLLTTSSPTFATVNATAFAGGTHTGTFVTHPSTGLTITGTQIYDNLGPGLRTLTLGNSNGDLEIRSLFGLDIDGAPVRLMHFSAPRLLTRSGGVTVDGDLLTTAGLVSAPAIRLGDTATGLYRAAADTVSVAVAGSERVRVKAAGVDVLGDVEATGNVIVPSGGRMDFFAETPANHYIRKNPSTSNLEFFSGGFLNFNVGAAGIYTRGRNVVINNDSLNWDFTVRTNGEANTVFVQGSTNRVGIGTLTPSTKLDVSGTATMTGLRLTGGGGTVPASASATGTAGDIRWDADYLYICVAPDTWKRAPLASW